MTDRNSSSKEISMTKVTDLIERLKDDSSDFVYHERHEAAAELLRLSSECEALRAALEPFAELADNFVGEDEDDFDTYRPSLVDRQKHVLVGWLRRAFTTLQETNGGGNADVS